MLKNILKLKGVKTLSKAEQRNVNGGAARGCNPAEECCALCTCGLSNWFIPNGGSCGSPTSCNGGAPHYGAGCV